VELADALAFARDRRQGVLTTLRSGGRPQLSNILFVMDGEGTASISVTDTRAKTRNLRRDPRASLYVAGDSFWSYVVLEGEADLTPVAAAPDDEVVEALVAMYRTAQGEHPDWNEYRRAMVEDGRLLIRLRPQHAYGQLGG
jgi:PPOX class probable F420-dependent enzyme